MHNEKKRERGKEKEIQPQFWRQNIMLVAENKYGDRKTIMFKTILKKDNINEFRRRKSYGDTNKQMQKRNN